MHTITIVDSIPSHSAAYKAALTWEIRQALPKVTLDIHTPILPEAHHLRKIEVQGGPDVSDVLDAMCNVIRSWALTGELMTPLHVA